MYYRNRSTVGGIGFFTVLVIGLLVATTNLGLINRFAAVKAGGGENLIGLRDALVFLVLFIGLLRLTQVRQTARVSVHPMARVTLFMVYLTPIAAAIGLGKGADLLPAARDVVMMAGWLLAWVIASNLNTPTAVNRVFNALTAVGLLVAVGVYIEMFTGGQLRVVTPADIVTVTRRSTPSGWPIMLTASSIVQVAYLFDDKATKRQLMQRSATWFLIVVAMLLTQSRTLLVAVVVSSTILVAVSFLVAPGKMRHARHKAVLLLLVFPLTLFATVWAGNRFIGADFGGHFMDRYSVLTQQERMLEYMEEDARKAEVIEGFGEYVKSPIWGIGLASPYRTHFYFDRASTVRFHNAYAFFLYRYGPLGILLFLMLIVTVFRSLIRALQDDSEFSWRRIGLALGIISLFVGAYFGNIFASTYGTPQAMLAIALLISMEEVFDPDASNKAKSASLPMVIAPSGRLYGRYGNTLTWPQGR